MILLLLLLIFIGAFSFTIFLRSQHNKNAPFRPPPGPKGLPFIGNLHQFEHTKPHLYFAKLAQTYGPIMSLRLGRRSMVVIQSGKLAKEILQTQHDNFCNRFVSVGAKKLSYNGLDLLFAPFNHHFREIKKIFMVHLLSSQRIHYFAPIHHEEISRLILKISSISSQSKIINLSELIVNYTTSKICRIAFGKRYESDEVARSKFHSLLNEAQVMFASFFYSDHFPSLGWLDNLSRQRSRLDNIFKKFDHFYEQIINDHLNIYNNNNNNNKPKSEEEDIVDILLRLKEDGSFPIKITLDHIKATLMNIFIGGTDTSIAMTIWVMTELIKNPNAMKKVQNELRTTIGNKGYIVEDDLSKLKYFKDVIKETFRLHPATPLLVPRETLQKTIIEGYEILPGTIVTINIWAIGRDSTLWNEPNLFKPERFMESSINFLGQDFELIPFGAGKRVCPGIQFGVVGLELLLANLLYFFNWKIPNGLKEKDIDTDVKFGVVMHKKNPLYLVADKFI